MTFAHLDAVLAEVGDLGRRFADAGFRLYLVGGIVRDQWLDHGLDASSDIDLTTDARPADIKRLVAPIADDLWTQGEKFGTIGLRAGGRAFEITTHRAESYTSESRKPQVSFGDDIDVDLSRRDFTVNAMAIELPDGELVDPFEGTADLKAGRLRTPLSPDVSFTDDPLRMLRAARFATKYALDPTSELTASAARLSERLRIVAIERIGVELERLLDLADVSIGLDFLGRTGLLVEVLGYGHSDLHPAIGKRVERAVAIGCAVRPEWRTRLAAIGLAVFDDANGVQAMCRRLRLSRDDERTVVRVASTAAGVVDAPGRDAEALRRWFDIANGADTADQALEVADAVAADTADVAAFRRAYDELAAQEPLGDVEFIDGATVMAALDVEPGPVIGRAHAMLREAYFRSGPMTPAEQIALLESWTP